jgi:U2 small nuclear ribonucleoprotein B''
MATDSTYPSSLPLYTSAYGRSVDGAVLPAAKRPNVQMPDEYLPPNKILFLQNLPETTTKEQLISLFSQYVLSLILSDLVCPP